jgi:hypothetical protein
VPTRHTLIPKGERGDVGGGTGHGKRGEEEDVAHVLYFFHTHQNRPEPEFVNA